MKRFMIVLLSLITIASFAFAADKAKAAPTASEGGLTPYVDKGELLVNAGIGWGGLSGGAEYTFARIDIAKVIPVTFGGAARLCLDPGIFTTDWTTFGIGAFGTAHVGFKNLTLPSGFSWFSNCDTYVGLGIGFASGTTSIDYYKPKPGIGISTYEGVSYYLNDKLALNFEYGYIGSIKYDWGYFGYSYPAWYSTVGAIFKL
jgi:hypothetical protein